MVYLSLPELIGDKSCVYRPWTSVSTGYSDFGSVRSIHQRQLKLDWGQDNDLIHMDRGADKKRQGLADTQRKLSTR